METATKAITLPAPNHSCHIQVCYSPASFRFFADINLWALWKWWSSTHLRRNQRDFPECSGRRCTPTRRYLSLTDWSKWLDMIVSTGITNISVCGLEHLEEFFSETWSILMILSSLTSMKWLCQQRIIRYRDLSIVCVPCTLMLQASLLVVTSSHHWP